MDEEDKKFTIKASVFAGLVVACPFLAYQLILETHGVFWAFISAVVVAIAIIFPGKKMMLK